MAEWKKCCSVDIPYVIYRSVAVQQILPSIDSQEVKNFHPPLVYGLTKENAAMAT